MQIFEQLSWLWISLEVLGSLAVIIGVWGEEHFGHKVLPYFKQERLKSRFWVILLVGLAIDLMGVVGATITSITLEERVEVLRKSNLGLQVKLQQRTISPKKIKDFIFLTDRIPKMPVSVGIGAIKDETFNYARQIRSLLNKAKFVTPDSETNFTEGIRVDPIMVVFIEEAGNTNEWTDLLFVVGTTNDMNSYQFAYESTNGFARPIILEDETDVANKTYAALAFAFAQIGITAGQDYRPEWIGTNQCGIFIRQKPQ